MDIFTDFKALKKDFNIFLNQYIGSINAPKLLKDGISYCLNSGGKSLRPVLLLKAVKEWGGSIYSAYYLAAAIECLHTGSLVHDDLPCIDNDDLRRGKPSAHKAFGEASAVIIGDALINLAYEMILSNDRADESFFNAARLISVNAGGYGVLGGQMLDINSSLDNANLELLKEIHLLKTARLFEACLGAAAVLSCLPESDIENIKNAALNLGTAFQIKDDILDVTENSFVVGKTTGKDKQLNKLTYASLMSLQDAKNAKLMLCGSAQSLLNNVDADTAFLSGFVEFLKA